MKVFRFTTLASVAAFTSLAACASQDNMKPAGGSPEIITDTAATKPPATTLTDSQIVGVLRTANDGEIEAGQLAKTLASNAKVADFGDMMVKAHGDANEKLNTCAQKTEIMPTDSALSAQLKTEHTQLMDRLSQLKGAEFEREYMKAMVEGHEKVLKMLDEQLIPNAKNDELQALVKEMRPEVAKHLQHARDLQNAPVASR